MNSYTVTKYTTINTPLVVSSGELDSSLAGEVVFWDRMLEYWTLSFGKGGLLDVFSRIISNGEEWTSDGYRA